MEKITLSTPLTIGKDQVSEITLREPSPGELRGVKLSNLLQLDVATVITVLPRVTAPYLDEGTISKLPMRDFTKLATGLVGFFVDAGETEPTAKSGSPTT